MFGFRPRDSGSNASSEFGWPGFGLVAPCLRRCSRRSGSMHSVDRVRASIAGWKLAAVGLASIIALMLLMRLRAPMAVVIPTGLFASWGGIPMLTVGMFRLVKSGVAQLRSGSRDGASRDA